MRDENEQPRSHDDVELRIPDLGLVLKLRPLPMKLARKLARATKDLTTSIRVSAKLSEDLTRSLNTAARDFMDQKITAAEYLDQVRALREAQAATVPIDLDDQVADLLVSISLDILEFYGHQWTPEDLTEKATVDTLSGLIDVQMSTNGSNDFLLAPLQLLTTIARRNEASLATVRSRAYPPLTSV